MVVAVPQAEYKVSFVFQHFGRAALHVSDTDTLDTLLKLLKVGSCRHQHRTIKLQALSSL